MTSRYFFCKCISSLTAQFLKVNRHARIQEFSSWGGGGGGGGFQVNFFLQKTNG